MPLHAREPKDVAAFMRSAREDRGMSQGKPAELLAFSRDSMVDLESGRPTVSMTRLFRVLHELGVSLTLDDESADGKP